MPSEKRKFQGKRKGGDTHVHVTMVTPVLHSGLAGPKTDEYTTPALGQSSTPENSGYGHAAPTHKSVAGGPYAGPHHDSHVPNVGTSKGKLKAVPVPQKKGKHPRKRKPAGGPGGDGYSSVM